MKDLVVINNLFTYKMEQKVLMEPCLIVNCLLLITYLEFILYYLPYAH